MKIRGGVRKMKLDDLLQEVKILESKLNIEQESDYLQHKSNMFNLIPNVDEIQSKDELDSVYKELYKDLRLYLNNVLGD